MMYTLKTIGMCVMPLSAGLAYGMREASWFILFGTAWILLGISQLIEETNSL